MPTPHLRYDATGLTALLVDTALAGGEAVMATYAGPIETRTKTDASPVTEADEAAETAILAILAERAPDVPVVAEESATKEGAPKKLARFFLVDPLDGTKEFISSNGEFTVNIALVEEGEPVAGVVYAPAIGRLFLGIAGHGAREARVVEGRAGAFRKIGVRAPGSSGLVAVASRSHAGPATEAFLAGLEIAARVSAGSSLKFCLIAAGEADLYPRLGRTMEWDTAAGHAVLAAAGGCVRRLDGTPLRYGKCDQAEDIDYANPHFVAIGAACIAREPPFAAEPFS